MPTDDPRSEQHDLTTESVSSGSTELLGDRYELRERFTRPDGTVAVVAHDRVDAGPVMVEFVEIGEAERDEGIRRIRDSATTIASLGNPSIVKIRDAFPYGTGIAVVSEAVSGQLLSDAIGTAPISIATAAHIGRSVALTLAAARGVEVAHGSLTAHDIIVGDAGTIYVANLGVRDAGVHSHSPILDAVYSAPEQLEGRAASASGDMYSLGVLLYEMVVGVPPFGEWDAALIAERKAHEVAPRVSQPLPLVPHQFDAVVAALLEHEPGVRPDAEQVAQVLGELAGPGPDLRAAKVRGTPARTVTQVTETITALPREDRSPFWIILASVLGLALLGVVGWLLLRDEGTNRTRVPAVVGQPLAQALARLEGAGFNVTTVNEANNAVPSGIVAGQSPTGGNNIREGSTVVVTVSTGPTLNTPAPPPIIITPEPAVTTTSTTTTTTTTSTTTVPPPP